MRRVNKNFIRYILFFAVFFQQIHIYAQCPTSDFTIASSEVCLNENINLINTSVNGSRYEWDFSTGSLGNTASTHKLGSLSSASRPLGLDIANDQSGWYSFVTSRDNNKLFRVLLGGVPHNNGIEIIDLGNPGMFLNSPVSIEMIEEMGIWYGLVHNWGDNSLIKLTFNEGLNKAPQAERIATSVGGSNSGMVLKNGGKNLVALVTNFASNSLSIVDFGSSINNVPQIKTSGAISGSSGLRDILLIRECGEWYGFVASRTNKRIIRLNFGSKLGDFPLSSTIVGENIFEGKEPTSIQIEQEGLDYYLIVNTINGHLYRSRLGRQIEGSLTSAENMSSLGTFGIGYNLKLIKVKGEWYGWIINDSNNELHRVSYLDDAKVDSGYAEAREVSGVKYSTSGKHLISLRVYNEEGGVSASLDSIQVSLSEAPQISFATNNFCINNTNTFLASSNNDASITNWHWDFGDGTTATGQQVAHQFKEAKLFEVKLTVTTIDGCSNTNFQFVELIEAPQAKFVVHAPSLCSNTKIEFENKSNIADLPQASFYWDFNGEGISTDVSPNHTFNSSGTKEVTLIVELSGCRDTINQVIILEEGPIVDFSYSNNCFGEPIQFENLSNVLDVSSILWEFGDGVSSMEENPSHFYSQEGEYNVILTISNSAGCHNKIQKKLIINNAPLATFSWEKPVVEGVVVNFYGEDLTIKQDSILQWSWILNEQVDLNGKTVSYVFNKSGAYNLKLKVQSAQNCEYETTMVITVSEAQCPTSDFTIASSEVCLNENINLINTSVNGSRYEWDFSTGSLGNTASTHKLGSLSSASRPLGLDIANDQSGWYSFVTSRDNNKLFRVLLGGVPHNNGIEIIDLGNPGMFLNSPVSIEMIEEMGIWYGLVHNWGDNSLIKLTFNEGLNKAPQAERIATSVGGSNSGMVLKNGGKNLVALVTNFASNSLSIVDFGSSINNVPQIKTSGAISGSSGLRDISLIRECGEWYGFVASRTNKRIIRLNFGSKLGDFPLSSTIVGENIFEGKEPTSIQIEQEGLDYYLIVNTINGHLYRSRLGRQIEGSLTSAENMSSLGTFGIGYNLKLIKVKGEWYGWIINDSNNELHRVSYLDDAKVDSGYAEAREVSGVKYSTSGKHLISLRVYNEEGGVSASLDSVQVSLSEAPAIGFTTENLCATKPNTFLTQNLTPDQTITSHTWTFPDGSQQTTEEASYQFSEPGTYKVLLNIESDNSCGNFFEKEVTVYPEPQAAYDLSASLVCSNAPIAFTNQTIFSVDSVITYTWDFKDGQTSTEKNPEHTFAEPGTYLVELQASIPGCTSSSTHSIAVQSGPQTLFAASPVCDEQTVAFTNQTSGEEITGYRWDLGDETFAQVENPVHVYDAPGSYLVQLEAENSLGCVTSHTQTVRVYSNPVPDFTVSPACAGNEVYFTDATADADGNIIAWHWEFVQADGSVITKEEENPVMTYAEAGNYEVALTAVTTWNCRRMLRKTIVVDAVPEVAIGIEGGCLGATTTLTDLTAVGGVGVQSWYWRVGEQVFTDSSFEFTFPEAGNYEIFLQLNLKNGCSVSGARNLLVEPLPEVSFDYSGACQGQTAIFEATVPADEYIWHVEGKIIVGQSQVLEHVFGSEGTYEVGLTVTNAKGCSNTLRQDIVVGQPPVAAFTADRQKGVAPFKVAFTNSSVGAVSYRWYFNDAGQSSSTEENPSFTFTEIGDYRVEMIAMNAAGCSDTVSQLVSVVDPNYDVVLNDVHLIRQDNGVQIVLALENAGTIRVTDMDIEVQINSDYTLSEKFTSMLEIGQAENYSMNMRLLENSGRKISFVCVRLKPVLSLVEEELSVVNNEKCLSFDQAFVMQEPYPNPGTDKVMLRFVLPSTGTVALRVYSAHGSLVESADLANLPVGNSQHELLMESWGKGIYFVRASFGGEEKSYRIMKK